MSNIPETLEGLERVFEQLHPRWRRMRSYEQCVVLVTFVLIVFIGVLVFVLKIDGSSVLDPQIWSEMPLLFVLPALVTPVGIVASLIFLYRPRGPAEPSLQGKLTVHVLMPRLDSSTPGDTLLQVGGFIAAGKRYGDHVCLKYIAHSDDAKTAFDETKKIIESTPKSERLCIIATMSRVSRSVYDAAAVCMKADPDLLERLSIVFTVASAPATPSDKKSFFQYFISGRDEADKIVDQCSAIKTDKNLRNPEVYLLGIDSYYPKQTNEILRERLGGRGFIPIPMNLSETGSISRVDLDRIQTHLEEPSFTILIAYDRHLVEALTSLERIGYSGRIYSTTTLSVKDWQDTIRSSNELKHARLNLKYLRVEGLDGQTDIAKNFRDDLHKVKWKHVLAIEELCPEKADFTAIEKLIYEKIDPNYISGFCYDAVRLFARMQVERRARLADEVSIEPGSPVLYGESLFDGLSINVDGGVDLELQLSDPFFPVLSRRRF